MTKYPTPPSDLSKSSKALFSRVVRAFDFDPSELALWALACHALDRANETRKILAESGSIYLDRFGAPRRHPAAKTEVEASALYARLVKQLGMEPPADESHRGSP